MEQSISSNSNDVQKEKSYRVATPLELNSYDAEDVEESEDNNETVQQAANRPTNLSKEVSKINKGLSGQKQEDDEPGDNIQDEPEDSDAEEDEGEEESNESEEVKSKEVELKRLKNAVPALQRKTSELLNQNKVLQQRLQEAIESQKEIAKKVAREVWNGVVENFDEIEKEVYQKKGKSYEDALREKFVRQVQFDNLPEEQKQLYLENQELKQRQKQFEMQQRKYQEEIEREEKLIEAKNKQAKFASAAQYVGGLLKKFNVPEDDPHATKELLQTLIDIGEHAKSDDVFAHVSDEDIARYYSDGRINRTIKMLDGLEWGTIKDKPESKKFLSNIKRILEAAYQSSGGKTIQRSENKSFVSQKKRFKNDDFVVFDPRDL